MITSVIKPVNKVVPLVKPSPDEWSSLLEKVGVDKDRQAFSSLFEHFAPLLKGFLMKGSNIGPELAEELAQETMIKVWRRAASFQRAKSTASTWIFTIARNSRIDLYRRESRKQVQLDADDFYDQSIENPSLVSLVQVRNKQTVLEHLKALPREQHEVVAKIYYEGKSHTEVAQELSLPLGTVKSRIRLALKRMSVRLAAEEI
jgi:RNA polymerase sigma-70 factor (ECF subfamily)